MTKPLAQRVALYIGTRKGAWILESDTRRATWTLDGPHFLGHVVNHVVLDPRDGRTVVAAVKAGHLGPTVYRSSDGGRRWREAKRPPAFRQLKSGAEGRSVDHVFWLTPGHASEPGVWYAGTSPQGLFRSEDGGATWDGVEGFNQHPRRAAWCGDAQAAPPDGATLHSINVDPRDPNHLYLAMSSGGAFESVDRGADWRPLNAGSRADFQPEKYPEYGQDVHCLRLHPLLRNRLYQQNHCGIYRLDRPGAEWHRIGARMPKTIGDIGFGLTLHARDPDVLWVFPMDGGTVWPRVSVGGKPAAYVSRNGGRTWRRQANGLPTAQGWFTVKRQALTSDACDPVGVYFGTSAGEIWGSRNEGERWRCLLRHLPQIIAVEAARVPR